MTKKRDIPWNDILSDLPSSEGSYKIKNDSMKGVGYYSDDGWTVFGLWEGNITHWRREQCPTH